MRDAWSEDNKGFVLKHCSVLGSSKYLPHYKMKSTVDTLCTHYCSSWSTSQAFILEMQPQHIFPRGMSGTESIKFKLWGLHLQQDPTPSSRFLHQQRLQLQGTVWSQILKHPVCRVPMGLIAGLWLPCAPKYFLFLTHLQAIPLILFFLFHRKETGCCVSILARNQREQATCQAAPGAQTIRMGMIFQQEPFW